MWKKYQNHKLLTSNLKSFHTFVLNATRSTPVTSPVTGIILKIVSIRIGEASGRSISKKIIYELVMQK